jgi:hypothetical protein
MYNLCRYITEALFVFLIFVTLMVEVVELIQCVVATRSVKDYFEAGAVQVVQVEFSC